MKKHAAIIFMAVFLGSCFNASQPAVLEQNEILAEDLLGKMTLEQKAGQMVQGVRENIVLHRKELAGLGSVLSGGGSRPALNTPLGWASLVSMIQRQTLKSTVPIPSLYGIDAVHGHNTLVNSTIFPHNIGLGAANDPDLVEAMGEVVALEVMKTRIPWNFGPCVALSEDPRWGRSYESFSSDITIISELGAAYVRGYQKAGGIATAKHYLGDGRTEWGTGRFGGIDRGDLKTDMNDLRNRDLVPYIKLVNEGVLTVMVSFSSINGEKMHGHKELLTDVLKGELGFEGFVVTDWEGLQFLPQETYEEQVWAAVNAGCDMLMEPYRWQETRSAIINGVEQGRISMDRIDDAVLRILKVKLDTGLFKDPLLKERASSLPPLRAPSSLEIARKLVEKSQVLLKNDNDLLPVKPGTKVYLTGPGMDNIGLQCGGWTRSWQGKMDRAVPITRGTTIKQALERLAAEDDFELITEPSRAREADMVLLVLAEVPYAEWEGDTPTPGITEGLAHPKNREAIERVKELQLPTAAVLLAGRHVSIEEELENWDAVVMAYLPGTEGDGIGNVLTGKVPFSGRLPMPWYKDVQGKSKEEFEELFPLGYGISTEVLK